jgi:putative ABC transport system permease protein
MKKPACDGETMEWAFGGLAFCTMVGLTFGVWPAIVASKLDPVKAKSYE